MHYKRYKSLLSPKNGMNIYRGCLHGCVYCDSRSECYNFDHPFEDIEIKIDAPKMLDAELARKRRHVMVATGSMTDPYLPLEKSVRYTRECLEVVLKHGDGIAIQTKSDLVLRDLDLLKEINAKAKAVVEMTLTTFDEDLCKILEPNVATTRRRYEVLKTLQSEGIPTVVWLSPILPYINDTETNLRGILGYCFDAGVKGILNFGMGMTLRKGDREYFYQALDEHFPGMKERYIRRFGNAYECRSEDNDRLMRIFHAECEAHGVMHNVDPIFRYLRTFPDDASATQMQLF